MNDGDQAAAGGGAYYPRDLSTEVHYSPADVAGRHQRTRIVAEHLTGRAFPGRWWEAHGDGCIDRAAMRCEVSPSVRELRSFMRTLGIRFFAVGEVVTPNHPGIAREYGYQLFIPPFFLWPILGVGLLVCDAIRAAIGEPIELRNAWRPQSYNDRVADSRIDSDHPNAAGFDLWFQSVSGRAKAEGFARGLHRTIGLDLSLGLGFRNLHIGTFSPLGPRHWTYNGYPDPPVGP